MRLKQMHILTIRCAAICACLFALWSGYQAVQRSNLMQAAIGLLAIVVAAALYRYLGYFQRRMLQTVDADDEPGAT